MALIPIIHSQNFSPADTPTPWYSRHRIVGPASFCTGIANSVHDPQFLAPGGSCTPPRQAPIEPSCWLAFFTSPPARPTPPSVLTPAATQSPPGTTLSRLVVPAGAAGAREQEPLPPLGSRWAATQLEAGPSFRPSHSLSNFLTGGSRPSRSSCSRGYTFPLIRRHTPPRYSRPRIVGRVPFRGEIANSVHGPQPPTSDALPL
jgi:hypothetical protein